MIRARIWKLLFCLAPAFIPGAALAQGTLVQISILEALIQGVYDGPVTVAELRTHGDFGLGTFNGLDGEMIVLDGRVFQMKADGRCLPAAAEQGTPFAAVTFFQADIRPEAIGNTDAAGLQRFLDARLPTPNLFYAVKITGEFRMVKTRSVPRQTPPYPKLTEVVKTQPVFERRDIAGTLVGFRCPTYTKGINLPGYHLHFLSADKQFGGHLLTCAIKHATVEVSTLPAVNLRLPQDEAFARADLGGTPENAVTQVEK